MIGDFGFRISDLGLEERICCSARSIRNPHSAFRTGVTLIELLITITIISILSAAFLGTSNLAMESSRKARTKTTIGKIHGLLMEKWSEYATRRVDIDTSPLNPPSDPSGVNSTNSRDRGKFIALARLDAVRILMRQEMPDRWSDILNQPVRERLPGASSIPPSNEISFVNAYQMTLPYPAVANAYLRRYNSLVGDVETIERNQGAECLYMTIMLSTADGEARTLFSEQDIGDTDGDGAPEFLDGWGRPIHYIRWPAGFAEAGLSDLLSTDSQADHDPLDVFRVDQPTSIPPPAGMNRAYRLLPLIYSSGPDGIPDLFTAEDSVVLNPYSLYPENNPVAKLGTPLSPKDYPFGIGTTDDNEGDDWLDNIHNHLQDNK